MTWWGVGATAVSVVSGVIQGKKADKAAGKAADRADAAAARANELAQQGYVDAQGRLSPFLNTETAANRQLMIEMGLGPNYTSELDTLRAELLELEGIDATNVDLVSQGATPEALNELTAGGPYDTDETAYLQDLYAQSQDMGISPQQLAQQQQLLPTEPTADALNQLTAAAPAGGYSPDENAYLKNLYQESLAAGTSPEVLEQQQRTPAPYDGTGPGGADVFSQAAHLIQNQQPKQTPYMDPVAGMGGGQFGPAPGQLPAQDANQFQAMQELAAAAPQGGYSPEQKAYLDALYQESLRTGIDPQVLAQQQQAPARGVPQPQPGGRIPGGVSAPPPSVRAPIYNQATAAANMPAVGQYTPYTDPNLGIIGPG